MNKPLLISTRCVFVVTLVFVVQRGDSMSLPLQGPHIHFNVHTPTQICRQIHTYTHMSLVLFPLFDFYPCIFSQPLKARGGSAPPFVFAVHVCVLRALHLPPPVISLSSFFPALNPVCPRVSRSSRSHLHPFNWPLNWFVSWVPA